MQHAPNAHGPAFRSQNYVGHNAATIIAAVIINIKIIIRDIIVVIY